MTRSGMAVALVFILSLAPAWPIATIAVGQDEAASGRTGTIVGTVIDGSTAEPIIEAGVEIIGIGRRIRTDLDGQFRIDVPPGTYQVRFFAPLYQGARIQKVVVESGKVATTDVSLQPSDAGVETVEVVAEADKAAEVAQLLERKKSAVVSDNVSAETIRKTPDSDAAEVVERLPSVTLREDSFIVVRGLNERYSRALLNGSRLPSPNPEKRAVPLDLFPASFVESISVAKSYTPDLPGDFSGGLASIQLKSFPDRRTFSLGLSTSVDTQATFNRFETYKGGGFDWAGFDQNVRSLPSVIPEDRADSSGSRAQFFGRSFKDIWDVDSKTAPPNYGVNFSVGDRFGPVGFYLAGLHNSEYKFRKQHEITYKNNGDLENVDQRAADDFTFDVSTFETELGGLFTTSYEMAPQHQVSLNTLYKRVVTDQVLSGVGQSEQFAEQVETTTFDYEQQELSFFQFVGDHNFDGVDVDWRTALGRTTQERPDSRFQTRAGGRFINADNGGIRAFADLTEWATDSALDVTVPFETRLPFTDLWKGLPAKFKIGPAYSYRDRDSELRRFRFNRTGSLDPTLPTEELMAPENIGPQGIRFSEQTKPQDDFAATEEIAAGYAMFDMPLIKDRLRLAAGVRTEYSLIVLETFDLNVNDDVTIRKKNTDPLPGVNLIYTPQDDMNVRLGWSMTVARPEFRELSPAVFPRPKGLRPLVGNPALEQSDIMSIDLRWEWFFTPTELVSIGAYYKDIDSPIEQIVISQGGTFADSFANAESADLYGVELEARKNLGFATPYLRNANVSVNLSWSDSEVTGTGANNEFAQNTTDERPLQGQTDWVINAAFEYVDDKWGTARLLYNYLGEAIDTVGGFGLDDINRDPRHLLDFVYLVKVDPLGNLPVNLKFAVENILDQDISLEQGGLLQRKWNPGVKFGFGVTYNY